MKEFNEELKERHYYEKETSTYLFKDALAVEVLGNMVVIRKKRRIKNLDLEMVKVYTVVFQGVIRTLEEFRTVLNIMER